MYDSKYNLCIGSPASGKTYKTVVYLARQFLDFGITTDVFYSSGTKNNIMRYFIDIVFNTQSTHKIAKTSDTITIDNKVFMRFLPFNVDLFNGIQSNRIGYIDDLRDNKHLDRIKEICKTYDKIIVTSNYRSKSYIDTLLTFGDFKVTKINNP